MSVTKTGIWWYILIHSGPFISTSIIATPTYQISERPSLLRHTCIFCLFTSKRDINL